MKLTPLRTFPLLLVASLALWGCAAGQPAPINSGAPDTRHDGSVPPSNEADPQPDGVSADDTAEKLDYAPIEVSDIQMVLEAILPMRANGWEVTLDQGGLPAFEELPRDSELLFVYLPAHLLHFGPAKYTCWGSSLVINSDDTIEEVIKNLPPELRPRSYLRIVSLFYRDGEARVSLAISKVQYGLDSIEFKRPNITLRLGVSRVNATVSVRLIAISVR